MDKQSILAELKSTGEWDRQSSTQLWGKAFKAYQDSTGEKLSTRCGSCYSKVKKWLLS